MAQDKIYIIGTGNQAPYGIGEIMEIIPARHIRKIYRAVSRYYNAPAMRLNGPEGQRMRFEFDQKDKLIGLDSAETPPGASAGPTARR